MSLNFPSQLRTCPYLSVVVAACGVVYKSYPTPNPSLGRGLSRRNRNFIRIIRRLSDLTMLFFYNFTT